MCSGRCCVPCNPAPLHTVALSLLPMTVEKVYRIESSRKMKFLIIGVNQNEFSFRFLTSADE
jgi:hypothetical protein